MGLCRTGHKSQLCKFNIDVITQGSSESIPDQVLVYTSYEIYFKCKRLAPGDLLSTEIALAQKPNYCNFIVSAVIHTHQNLEIL